MSEPEPTQTPKWSPLRPFDWLFKWIESHERESEKRFLTTLLAAIVCGVAGWAGKEIWGNWDYITSHLADGSKLFWNFMQFPIQLKLWIILIPLCLIFCGLWIAYGLRTKRAKQFKIDIKPESVLEGPTMRPMLKVRVTNMGSKVVWVERVGVLLEPRPTYPVGNPSAAITPDTSELIAHQKDFIVSIKEHGDLHIWQLPFDKKPHFLITTKDGDKYGKGYVLLTTGEKIDFEFILFPDSTWERL